MEELMLWISVSLFGVFFFIAGFGLGRESTSVYRTREQNRREREIDFWARRHGPPAFEVDYDWKSNRTGLQIASDDKE